MSLLASRTSVQSLIVSCLADTRTVFSVVSPSDVPNTVSCVKAMRTRRPVMKCPLFYR